MRRDSGETKIFEFETQHTKIAVTEAATYSAQNQELGGAISMSATERCWPSPSSSRAIQFPPEQIPFSQSSVRVIRGQLSAPTPSGVQCNRQLLTPTDDSFAVYRNSADKRSNLQTNSSGARKPRILDPTETKAASPGLPEVREKVQQP